MLIELGEAMHPLANSGLAQRCVLIVLGHSIFSWRLHDAQCRKRLAVEQDKSDEHNETLRQLPDDFVSVSQCDSGLTGNSLDLCYRCAHHCRNRFGMLQHFRRRLAFDHYAQQWLSAGWAQ